ncbi:MAG: Hpt domain-containing protein, partial [Planctomycetota bacterium]
MDARDPSNVDPALLDLFRAELDTHLPVLSDGLLALEKGHVDEPMIAAMMRAAHSIKGAARIVGFTPAVRVAHALEDCFTAARDQRVPLTSAAVDVLLDGVDTLQRVCAAQPENPPDEAMLASLLARIAAVREGRAEKRAAAAPPAPAPAACGAGGEVRVTLPGEL